MLRVLFDFVADTWSLVRIINDEAHYGKGSGSTYDYPDDLTLARTDVPITPGGLRESRQSQKQTKSEWCRCAKWG
jgi:hypothetical protein